MPNSNEEILNTTLTHVIQKAMDDFKFFELLIENIDQALISANFELKKDDRDKLKNMLDEKFCLTGEELLALINFLKSGSLLYRSFPVWSGRP